MATTRGSRSAAIYSNRGWYTLAGYNDPNIAYTNLFGSLHAFLGSGLVENDAPDGSIEQSFDMTRFDLEYSLGWTFWDRISPVWNGGVRMARVRAVHVPGSEPATDATVAVQGFQLIYSDRRYRDFYDAGLRLSAEVQHAFPLDRGSPAYNDAIFDAKWAWPAPLGGFLDDRAAHAFVGVDAHRVRGAAGRARRLAHAAGQRAGRGRSVCVAVAGLSGARS